MTYFENSCLVQNGSLTKNEGKSVLLNFSRDFTFCLLVLRKWDIFFLIFIVINIIESKRLLGNRHFRELSNIIKHVIVCLIFSCIQLLWCMTKSWTVLKIYISIFYLISMAYWLALQQTLFLGNPSNMRRLSLSVLSLLFLCCVRKVSYCYIAFFILYLLCGCLNTYCFVSH